MDINCIEEFVVLAEVCNYGRAADALFISQSSLFNHIKALEGELGVALFKCRGKNRGILTAAETLARKAFTFKRARPFLLKKGMAAPLYPILRNQDVLQHWNRIEAFLPKHYNINII